MLSDFPYDERMRELSTTLGELHAIVLSAELPLPVQEVLLRKTIAVNDAAVTVLKAVNA
jgi:hypothetical protein